MWRTTRKRRHFWTKRRFKWSICIWPTFRRRWVIAANLLFGWYKTLKKHGTNYTLYSLQFQRHGRTPKSLVYKIFDYQKRKTLWNILIEFWKWSASLTAKVFVSPELSKKEANFANCQLNTTLQLDTYWEMTIALKVRLPRSYLENRAFYKLTNHLSSPSLFNIVLLTKTVPAAEKPDIKQKSDSKKKEPKGNRSKNWFQEKRTERQQVGYFFQMQKKKWARCKKL